MVEILIFQINVKVILLFSFVSNYRFSHCSILWYQCGNFPWFYWERSIVTTITAKIVSISVLIMSRSNTGQHMIETKSCAKNWIQKHQKKQLLHFLETSCNKTNNSTIQTIYLFPPPKKCEKFPRQINHIAICGEWLEVVIFLLISVQSWRLWTPSNSLWGGFGY